MTLFDATSLQHRPQRGQKSSSRRRWCWRFAARELGWVGLLVVGFGSGIQAPAGQAAYRPDRILVQPKAGIDPTQLAQFHQARNVQVLRQFKHLGQTQVLRVPTNSSVPALVQAYLQSGLVEWVEPDYLVRLAAVPNDPYYTSGALWHLHNYGQNGGVPDADIDAPEAWDTSCNASNVIVAIVDTGVRFSHEDLAANMWVNPGEVPGNGLDDDGNGYVDDVHGINAAANDGNPIDLFGHGTQVAGLAGAVGNNGRGITGTAWRVRLMACRFYDDAGNGSISDVIECFDYARQKGAHIINASFVSDSYSVFFYNAIKNCRAAGILVVAAAGNNGTDNDRTPQYPASYDLDNIIAVAATTRTDALASFSNYGATSVDLGAPGVELTSTSASSDSAYTQGSGTSFAAPVVSGALALLKARFPSDTYLQLRNRLFEAVDPLPSLAGKCVTGGRLNLARAVGPAVIADFVASPSAGSVPLTVQFTDRSYGNITNWAWSFGDGATSSLQNPTHTYTAAGTYIATLTVTTDTGATSTTNRTISVVANYTLTNGTYSWIDPAGMTPLSLADNGVSAALALPFTFWFYGQAQTQLFVGANGLVGFSSNGLADPNNTDLPNTALPNGVLCPFWDDLNPANGGTIYFGTVGTAPTRKVVVSWVDVYRAGGLGRPAAYYTFQLWLEEGTSRIQFQYKEVNPGSRNPGAQGASATVGLEHPSGEVAVRYCYNTASLSNNMAILFLPPAAAGLVVTPADELVAAGPVGGPFAPDETTYILSNASSAVLDWSAAGTQPWVSVSANGGTLMPGASTTLTVFINSQAQGLAPGTYTDTVLVSNITSGVGSTSRSVTLTVEPVADQLVVSPDALLSSSGHVGGPFVPASHLYVLTNAGGTALDWSASVSVPWLDLAPAAGTLGPGASHTVSATFNAQAARVVPGSNYAQITFTVAGSGSNSLIRGLALMVYPLPTWAGAVQVTEGRFEGRLTGVPSWTYVLEASTNLVHWTGIATNQADATGVVQFTDPAASTLPRRFYRAVTAP
jgi:subtilisin family serine protease